MSKSLESVFEVVKKNTLEVLFELDPDAVTLDGSLVELGANSVDRVEILMNSMADLGLVIPRAELQGIANLRGLTELLHRHLNQSA